MKNRILGAAALALAAACGGGKAQLIDAGVDAQFACDPIAQTGCMASEKCTWLVDIDADSAKMTEEIGHIGCAPATAGDIADGGACDDAKAGTNNGADSCAKGELCIARKCKPLCDPQATGVLVAGACKTNFACTTYAGVFTVSGGPASAGVCEPACDPLTQQLKVGTTNIDACGAADPTMPDSRTGTGGACVPTGDRSVWACAPTFPDLYGKTDYKDPFLNPAKAPYPNGCAAGFLPLFVDMEGSMHAVCNGICAPLKTDKVLGATDPVNQGDPNALVKLVNEAAPKAGNGVCVEGKKGSTIAGTHGEDCRFWWALFQTDETSPYNDTVGFCFAYDKFIIPKSNPAMPLKSCAELSPPQTAANDDDNAALQGCYPFSDVPMMLRSRHRAPILRAPYGQVPLLRHVFE